VSARFWWSTRAPLAVAAARLRRHPGRGLLVAAGLAASIATLVIVDGGSVVARDRAAQRALAELPPSERSFRVDVALLPPGVSYAGADRFVRRALATLTPQAPLRTSAVRVVRVGGGLVQLVGVDGLARLAVVRSGRLPVSCGPVRCELLAIGGSGGGRSRWSQPGLDLVRVGSGEVADRALFGSLLEPAGESGGERPAVLVAAGASAFDRVRALDGIQRAYSWIAPIAARKLHVWQIGDVLRRESLVQAALAQTGDYYALSGPDQALTDARTRGRVQAARMVLIGGEAGTLLLGFALVAAVGLRRGLAAERRRLLQRGARRHQLWLALVAEIGALTTAGALIGAAAGAAGIWIVASHAGVPAGAVLARSLGSASGIALVVGGWLVGTAAVVVVSRGRDEPRRGLRILDVTALGAAAAIAIGLARGGLSASAIASGGNATLLLLLPGLVCFVAAVLAGRLMGPLMRLAERSARRGPVSLRLALLGLSRAPSRTVATAAFLLVALGLAFFAASYRATLERGARDEAAFAVPLDYAVTEGTQLVGPLDAATLAGYERLAPGTRAYPVVRVSATVAGSGATLLGPTVLGIPGPALAALHWRSDYAGPTRGELVRRLTADGPVSLRGLPTGPGVVTLPVRIRGPQVQLDLVVGDEAGRTRTVRLGTRSAGSWLLKASLPHGTRKLVGLEVSLAPAAQFAFLHVQAEAGSARSLTGDVTLGPLHRGSRTLTRWRGWLALGAEQPGPRLLSYSFDQGQTVLLRLPQPTDGKPLRVVVSPDIARSAGPGGTVTLGLPDEPVEARIVGVADRFPDAAGPDGSFVVAEESRLATVLDSRLPGTGAPLELWLSGPASLGPALQRLPVDVASRRSAEQALASDPLAHGLILTLGAAAVVALALAAIGFWLSLLSQLRDERGELFDLEAQGAAPSMLRTQIRLRSAVLVALGAIGGALLGLVLSRLVVALVRVSAVSEQPEPPLRLEADWVAAAAGLGLLLVAAALVVELTTRSAFRGDSPARASWSLE
jgi:hypothetical protein